MWIWLGEKWRRKATEAYHASNWKKIAPDEILQTTHCKCVSIQCNKDKCSCVRAGLNCLEFSDCQQSDYQIDMHMDDNEIEAKNNDSESGTEDE